MAILLFCLLTVCILAFLSPAEGAVKGKRATLPIIARDDIEHTQKGWLLRETRAPFTGVSIKHHQNGNVSGMMTIRNGVMDGPMVTFHDNGYIAVQGMMKDNRKIGYWHYFIPSGILQKTRIYKGEDWVYEARYNESGKLEKVIDFRKTEKGEQSPGGDSIKAAPQK